MNIGIFTDCYLPTNNGVSTAIVQAREELERRGHRVTVFTVADPTAADTDPAVRRFPSLPVIPEIDIRLGFASQLAIDRIVARERLDLIHTHTEFTLGWAGKRAAARAGLPVIHTLHTLYPLYRHYVPLGRLVPVRAIAGFLNRLVSGYDSVVCPSEKARAYLASAAPAAAAVVIPNGVSPERFGAGRVLPADSRSLAAALGLDPVDRIILYAGRLAEEKRVLPLLAALSPLLRSQPDCRLVLAGTGPARDALNEAVAAAGLQRQVLLAGPVPWERMAELYTVAHAFATASLSEMHPMTVLEATFCGLPIVARRDLGLADVVRDGCNGYLVDSDAELAPRLAAILADDPTRRRFAADARSVAADFTIAAHVDRLEGLYRRVIDHHGLRKAR